MNPSDPPVFHRVVLTGGPCGGKTTLQVMLSDVFENMGYTVYRVHEAATLLLGGGVVFGQLDTNQANQFQLNLLKVLLALEDTYMDLAKADTAKGKKTVVICDRGAMDPSAYMPREDWLKILEKENLDEIALRDGRYDCVIHMVSTAYGAENFFTAENNRTRSEGIELARHLDDLVSKAWIGHPYYDIIDNSTGFEDKKNRVIAAVLKRLGLNDDKRQGKDIIKRKFLIKNFDMNAPFHVAHRDFDVEHHYLIPGLETNSQMRIRKRGSHGSFVYTLTVSKFDSDGEKIEIRRTLSPGDFDLMLSQRDPNHCSIIKKRRCFVWENQYYQIDYFHAPHPGLILLEAYVHYNSSGNCSGRATPRSNSSQSLSSSTTELNPTSTFPNSVPPFLSVEKEVTGDPFYSMFNLSKLSSSP